MNFPYFPNFIFSSIAASTRNSLQLLIPHTIAVYGIAISSSGVADTTYYEYRLQFQNYDTGDTLFDEPIQAFNIQSNCLGYLPVPNMSSALGGAWILPSKWFIQKNQKIICKLDTFADSITESYYVTLLGHTVDADPNPGVQPFVYSYPMRMGFQDNVDGQTSVNFNQQVTNTLAKPMIHDFELRSVVLDPFGTNGFTLLPGFSLQISWPGKKLFDRLVINGVAGGGAFYCQNGQAFLGSGGNFGFPNNNVIQYVLPNPEIIGKGAMVRVDISPAPTYMSSDQIHSSFNEEVCMALIGNHLG